VIVSQFVSVWVINVTHSLELDPLVELKLRRNLFRQVDEIFLAFLVEAYIESRANARAQIDVGVWFLIMILGFAVCGGLCVFRTNMLVTWGRKNAKTKFAGSPFSSIPNKLQYPTYIRCAGAFIWLWAIAIIYAVVFLHFR